MRVESQIPIVGSALVGGLAQSWLIQRWPQYSWALSLALVGGGMYLATRGGTMEQVGLGVASAGAAAIGTTLTPVTPGTTGRLGRVVRRPIGSTLQLPAGVGATAARVPEFEEVREW